MSTPAGPAGGFWENLGLVDQWREWYLASDQAPHYAYLKKVLKALQWMRGPNRWVLKSPQHLEQLRPIMEIFHAAPVLAFLLAVFTLRN